MDTEGHELEALKGSINTLNITEFVAVDFENEKGENQDHTIVSVSNYFQQDLNYLNIQIRGW